MNNGLHGWGGGQRPPDCDPDTFTPIKKKKTHNKKTADKHTVVDIHKEAFTVPSPLFLSLSIVERPVVTMSLWTPGGREWTAACASIK